MLQSIKSLYGNKLGALDGEIGHVQDFYFDDQNWAIRYLVVDTGSWLLGRQVLISPHSLGPLSATGNVLAVRLTQKQIENSPSIESHKPISRQFEADYYRYYGWPYYWNGDALWGMSGVPILEMPPTDLRAESVRVGETQTNPADAHLRNTQAVKGYQVLAQDTPVGHVVDFLVEPQSWAIRHLVVKTGHLLSGKEMLIATGEVKRISYDESTVFAKIAGLAVEQSSAQPVRLPS